MLLSKLILLVFTYMHIFITFHFSPAPTVYLILLAVATLVGISVCTDHYAWMDYSHDELVMSKS